MSELIINVENLSKIYKVRENSSERFLKRVFSKKIHKEVEALKEVSFSIQHGEFVGLIGNNGAGKSTLIKLLTGILYKTTGNIEVMGNDPFKHRIKNNAKIGVVFGQRTQLNWDLSTMNSLNLLKRIYSIENSIFEKNIKTFVEIFDMDKFIGQPVRTLSLGQRMQCEILAAFLHNPEIIFLDEPTIGLDVFSKEAISKFLNYVKEKFNTTVILTTHDLEEMSKICDRAIVMNEGEILLKEDINKLLALNNEQKRIVFTTENESHILDTLNLDYEIKVEPFKIVVERIQKENIHKVISNISSKYSIKDIRVEENNFTQIVKSYLEKANGGMK